MNNTEQAKGRRVSVDLSAAATGEIDRLKKVTGLTTADLFRNAITLLRIYIDSREKGKEFRILDPDKPSDQVRLELGLSIEREYK